MTLAFITQILDLMKKLIPSTLGCFFHTKKKESFSAPLSARDFVTSLVTSPVIIVLRVIKDC